MRAVAAFAAVTLGGLVASQSQSLQVLRVSPTDRVEPTGAVTVAFDRPVAGQLDGTVDPRSIFTIAPAVQGRLEWRDPITLRFTPTDPLPAGTQYAVTIANSFRAMDGSRLDQPYRFTFRVSGPRAIAGSPVGPWGIARYLRPDAVFGLLVTAPVDLGVVSRLVRLELSGDCPGPRTIALTATGQRRVTADDPDHYRYAGGWPRNLRAEALHRVVRLQPERPLPLDCPGALTMPATLDTAGGGGAVAWRFATYGPLRLTRVRCTNGPLCPAGYAVLEFTTPLRGSEVLRGVRLTPTATWTLSDTAAESATWMLEGALRQRTTYTIAMDSSLRDVFGQRIAGSRTTTLATTGYAPGIEYPRGRMLVERESFRTLAVRHVNVDTLYVTQVAVPESLEARVLAAPDWNLDDVWPLIAAGATTRAIALGGAVDTPLVSAVRMPAYNASRPGQPALTAVRIAGNRIGESERATSVALVQVTNLGLAGRLGSDEAVVWVTTLHDGQARPGAAVTLHGRDGRIRARGTTDAQGLVRFAGWAPDSAANGERTYGFEGYASATWQSDRAVLAFDSYTWELSPWRFNVQAAGADERVPAAGAVFTERGIYRPGEVVHAKAIVRTGNLGALRVPARGDSIRWVFSDREDGLLRDTTVAGTAFGTAAQALPLAATLPLGTYRVSVKLKRGGGWVDVARTTYRVAEYRPPEFLVSVGADTAGRLAGDTLTATVEARYLFGAPMARVPVRWTLRRETLWPWEVDIPGTTGFYLGEDAWWQESGDEDGAGGSRVETMASGTDTLDGDGRAYLRVALGTPRRGRPARAMLQATVTDVNRQVVVASAAATVHPAGLYVGARPRGSWFWTAGTAVGVDVIAVRPSGERLAGVAVSGALVRREWHVVHRRREGVDQRVGEWVADTVARCDVTTAADAPASCGFTPPAAGSYVVTFRARDAARREAATSFYRWASGRDWVPWEDESQFRMDVIPDRSRYDVGDTATVLLASPFAGAEAWVTIEREGVIEQRRLRLESNATVLRLPLTEAHVPNVYVSVVVIRGRSAAAGGINDPGRPALRVGYAELKVTPSVKRLSVEVRPVAAEYRPGDSVRVRVRVRDSRGVGRRSEVTLWAADEGVLALTGYRTPDPVDLIYRARGVGMRLASSLASVAAQVMEQEGLALKGDRAPGGGGGLEGGDVLRSRFASTAFFLGSVETDEAGEAVAAARLPDNLTTFRVMAVAVTAGDRYGSGESRVLVTRPLLARPALPRFLRSEDRFTAGVVVHRRGAGPSAARVSATVRGSVRTSPATRAVTVPADRGTEVRFAFRGATADTAAFRFDVSNGRDSDAVLTRLPVRPSWVPRAHSAAGTVALTAGVELSLPADIDPERSRLVFSVGTSPLALVAGMSRVLRVYPFDCTEQIVDVMLPLVAMVRAGAPDGRRLAPADARAQIDEAIAVLVRRQRPDGSIGLWSASSWSTPWLSAYAGDALLAARAAGFAVPDSVLGRLAGYLTTNYEFRDGAWGPVSPWGLAIEVVLAENVAAVDYLSRLGRPDVARENDLLRRAPQMTFEDRARLAGVLARRGATDAARNLLAPLWASVRVEGRRAVLPETAARAFYFRSARRPIARLLSATLAADSAHALVGPLVETLVEQGRAITWWNTHDYGIAVQALSDFTARQQRAARRGYTVGAAGRVLFRSAESGDVMREHSASLTGLLVAAPDGSRRLALNVAAPSTGRGTPLYFFATVHEVPRVRPVRPDQQGIEVERWYEDYATGRPTTSVVEGSLVRVRLRIRVPAERRFLALTDPLPAGLEAVDLSLRTAGAAPGPGAWQPEETREDEDVAGGGWRWGWYFGAWDGGWWSPFDHRELRDDRVAYVATYLWPGTYTATYVARATTPGVFTAPPAHAEEMYNPAVQGRSDGGVFTVARRGP